MREAVVIGAGCLGRGFVGPLFSSAGWHVTFLDAQIARFAAGPGLEIHLKLIERYWAA